MLQRGTASHLGDLLTPVQSRNPVCAYFVRLDGWSAGLGQTVWACHEAARRCGVLLDGGLPNPDPSHLAYYRERLGDAFSPAESFIRDALAKWLPAMLPARRQELAGQMAALLAEQQRQGKSDSMLRSLFVKLMCWLYYRFRGIADRLGGQPLPLILCCAPGLSAHALAMLRLLNALGADVLLLEPEGDSAYLSLDPGSAWSQRLAPPDPQPYPPGFSLKKLREQFERLDPRTAPAAPASRPAPQAAPVLRPKPDPLSRLETPARIPQPNVWMETAGLESTLLPLRARGKAPDPAHWPTVLLRCKGVRDKVTYPNDLYQFYRRLTAAGRQVCVLDGALPVPEPDELEKVRRLGKYPSAGELALSLADNLQLGAFPELTRAARWAFVKAILEADAAGEPLHRLLAAGVYTVCWIRRTQRALFRTWTEAELPVLLRMGHCENDRERLFFRWISLMPVDLILFAPDLGKPDPFTAPGLLELDGPDSLPEFVYPRDAASLKMRTLAAHAERELTELLCRDSGLYRDRQFQRAAALTLQSTEDEIALYWQQELPYRPGFSVEGGVVTLPVLWARLSGVPAKDGPDALAYWYRVKALAEAPDTLYYPRLPLLPASEVRAMSALAAKYLKDGRIDAAALVEDRQYPYRALRGELQAHMLEKAQELLDQRLIRGTFRNGTEYTVLSAVLSLPPEVTRLIQAFDFTRRNPKLVCLHTQEREASLEDAILLTYLSLLGFDIVLFVPTGYQTVERFLAERLPAEHQLGPYRFDLQAPDLRTLPPKNNLWQEGLQWIGNLFKRP